MKPIKLMLVDDHKVIRDGIKSYFDNSPEYKVIAEAQNGKVALKVLQNNKDIDIVITDITMRLMDGITLTKEIKKQFPQIGIIAMTMLNDNKTIKSMLNAGASGYLLKENGEKELKEAILKVFEGETYYSPAVAQVIMENLIQSNKKRNSSYGIEITLSEREIEILKLIVEQYSNKEIAEKLHISARTVDAHKRNLLDKTGSKNIAGLVMYAVNNHLIEY